MCSVMGEDEVREVHNKVIKEDNGCVGLVGNIQAIPKWGNYFAIHNRVN